mmetsp:Transcript_22859/g.34106  ORF Transcript_22859/g.34106 Transcript_22859/m.34106 type:complete len:349 (-) Transcript_22859:57-1103(-)
MDPLKQFDALTGGKESRHESWYITKEDPLVQMKKSELEWKRLQLRNPIRAMIMKAQHEGRTIHLTPEQEQRLAKDNIAEAERTMKNEKLRKLGLGQMLDGTTSRFVGKARPRLQKFRDMMDKARETFIEENAKMGYATPGRTVFSGKKKHRHRDKSKREKSSSSRSAKHEHRRNRHHSSRHKDKSDRQMSHNSRQGLKDLNKTDDEAQLMTGDIEPQQLMKTTKELLAANPGIDTKSVSAVVENFGEMPKAQGRYTCEVPGCRWKNDDEEMTKKHIEQHFGLLRAQQEDSEELLKKTKDGISKILGMDISEINFDEVGEEIKKQGIDRAPGGLEYDSEDPEMQLVDIR